MCMSCFFKRKKTNTFKVPKPKRSSHANPYYNEMTIGTEHCIHTNTTEDMYILRTDGCPHDARFKDGATQKQERKKKKKTSPFHFGVHVSQSSLLVWNNDHRLNFRC